MSLLRVFRHFFNSDEQARPDQNEEEMQAMPLDPFRLRASFESLRRTSLSFLTREPIPLRPTWKNDNDGDEEFKYDMTYPIHIASDTSSPLRDAIRQVNQLTVTRLLAIGVRLDGQDEDGMTPLHYSIYRYLKRVKDLLYADEEMARNELMRAKDIIQIIVAAVARNNKDVLERRNRRGHTLLYTVIKTGDLELVNALVTADADLENVSKSNETVLHAAAKYKQDRILKYFLENYNVKNSVDDEGYTPLHCAAHNGMVESVLLLFKTFGNILIDHKILQNGWTVWHMIAVNGKLCTSQEFLEAFDLYEEDLNSKVGWFSWDCNKIRYVLPGVNEADDKEETPVYMASSLNHVAMTAFLLRHGATLSLKSDLGVVDKISEKFANPLTFFEDVFDDCIKGVNGAHYVYVNYEVFTDGESESKSQVQIIEQIVKRGHNTLLQHPLIESLICLKWNCLLPMFYVSVATYVAFLVSFNAFVITSFSEIDKNSTDSAARNITLSALGGSDFGWGHWTLIAFVYVGIGALFTQECFWIHAWKVRYFLSPESWVRLCGLALATTVPVVVGSRVPTADSMSWQRVGACVALLLTWLQAMLLLSRFPGWGFYAFRKSATNLLKILLTSVCFVIAFSSCFIILYKSKPPFDGVFAAFTKTLVMMSSEFEYEALFDDEYGHVLTYTKPFVRLIFITFVIFVAIVLMNLMISVACSDINELNDVGNIRRLAKQLELLSYLEGLERTMLGKWWPGLTHAKFHKVMCVQANHPDIPDFVVKSTSSCIKKCCKPTLHSKLHNAIFDIAKKKKNYFNTLDALHEALVGVRVNQENENGDSSFPVTTLNYNMKLIYDSILSIQNTIEVRNLDLRQQSDRLQKEKEQSDDQLNKLKKMIELISEDTNKGFEKCIDDLKNAKDYMASITKTNNKINRDISKIKESMEETNKEFKQSIGDIRTDLNQFLAKNDEMLKMLTSLLEKSVTVTINKE